MMTTGSSPIRRALLALAACAVAVSFVLASAQPALAAVALKGTSLTLNQTSGGKPTRFTLTTNPAQPTEALSLTFPDSFDLSKSTIKVTTFDGITKTAVVTTKVLDGQTVRLTFAPAVAAGNEILLEVFEVVPPIAGGQFDAHIEFTAGGVKGETTAPPFKVEAVSFTQSLSESVGRMPFVKAWDSVKFFNLFMKPEMIITSVPLLFTGWLMSIGLVAVAFPFAIAGGLLLAFAKMSKLWPVRAVANVYINVIRGTPLFLQIFVAFVGLPIAGLTGVPLFPTGVLVLALNSSAYLAEIFRAGIQSINKGQFEAASSLGMTYPQSMAFVIIPQTVKRVLPTMTSEFILLFKDTALLSAVGVFELMLYSNSLATKGGNLTPFMVAAVYYLIVTIPLINWVGNLEAKLAVSEHGHTPPTNKKRGGLFWRPASAGPESELQASVAEHESR